MAKKVSFNMLFDENQKEILEYLIDSMYCGADIPKAAFLQWLIKDAACDCLGLSNEDRQGITDEMILKIFKHEAEQNRLTYDEIINKISKNDISNGVEI